MLVKLLREKLRPYKRQIYLVIALQAVQTTAALLLPTLNARIIDDGVLRGRPRLHPLGGRAHALHHARAGRVRGGRRVRGRPGRHGLRA